MIMCTSTVRVVLSADTTDYVPHTDEFVCGTTWHELLEQLSDAFLILNKKFTPKNQSEFVSSFFYFAISFN